VPDEFDVQASSVAALGDPVRRGLYRYVVGECRPVSREQAAAALDIAQHVAKFHLDRLERDGLLDIEYSRPPGRSGPGAGRPSKLYRRAEREFALSLPERRYDLAGRVLAAAITDAERTGLPPAKVLRRAAARTGRQLAVGASRDAPAILAEHGYQPYETDAGFALANCPFHSLAKEFPELVCGLNLDLVRGLLRGAGGSDLRARLDPAPDRCCVTLVRRARPPSGVTDPAPDGGRPDSSAVP
jgi:predicted ArsR family transcriptional regulator